jgi:L-ascorbate metabolism protein UlaG (beta-lactamase superfamily)
MRIEWYGQSAFRLTGAEGSVVIDPFGDVVSASGGRLRFDYPPIPPEPADLVLITHEHFDHNDAAVVGGEPVVLRSTAGRLDSPIGEVLAIASEHDQAAGTERGPNTIFVLALDGLRIAHFGDFGQRELREEQAAAIGSPDVLFLPVGGPPPTIAIEHAAAIVARLTPRWVIPMHYRTERIDFLEPLARFIELIGGAEHAQTPSLELPEHRGEGPVLLVPATP